MDRVKSNKLSSTDHLIAQRIKLRIGEITTLNRVIVFGSRARGESTPESDLDVFIEVPELDANLRRRISEIAWEISLDAGVLISTFVVTPKAISDTPLGANPILRTITQEGILV